MPVIHIKNMVCYRCRLAVREVFEKTGLSPLAVKLGEVEVAETPTEEQKQALREQLRELDFELLEDNRSQLIEKIKTLVICLIHEQPRFILRVNMSDYLAEKTGRDYPALSHLFSETEGVTLEKYFIAQRIEKAKELLSYDELSLSEIADRLGYSSVHHLSGQFRKITGLTPTHFRRLKENQRKPLDSV